MKKEQMIIFVIAIVVVGAAAFFGGIKYQQSKRPTGQFAAGFNGQNRGGAFGQARQGAGRPVLGDIIAQDDKSITVKMQDGSSKIVVLPDSLTVSKTDTGSKDDLKVGAKVGVFGTDNSDGTVTAQNIQLNPMFRLGQGGGQPGAGASPR